MSAEAYPLQGYYVEPTRTMWDRFGFGVRNFPRPDHLDEHPDFAPGWLTTKVFVHLGWADRLRALFTGNLMVSVGTKTDTPVSRATSTSAVSIMPPGNMNRGQQA